MKCNKCHSELSVCQDCKGQTQRSFLGDIFTCRTWQFFGSPLPVSQRILEVATRTALQHRHST